MQVIGDIARLGAKRYPDKVALIMDRESLTYLQLNQQANQLAHGLLSLNVTAGDRVAILAFNCLEYPVVNYAVAKCGGTLVPINFRYKKDELVYVVNNSNPRVLFYGSEFSAMADEAKNQFDSPVHLVAISGEPLSPGLSLKGLMDGQSLSEPGVNVNPTAPSFIMYTSGTTGFPKGTLFSHASYLNVFIGMTLEGDLKHDDVVLVCLPLFHNGGLNAMLQPTLMVGGTCLIVGKGFDPDKILDAVARYKVTLTMWVPTQLAMLVNHPRVASYNVSTLKKIWYGSSAITPTTLEASMDVFKAGFYQWYGQVETGMVSILRPEDHLERSQCTGREMFNADLRIVDEEGKDTPIGEVGEIISAQKPLGMIGYYKMEEANKRTVRDGWIHTEDLARVEGSGYFTIVDRLRDMIISGAENIYPKEIEDVISRHPGVREVAVFGIPDEIYGESVCAVVVRKEGHSLDQEEIINFCASRLSSYKKPKRVDFIGEIPKNASGKVTKNVLREPYWANRGRKV
ncbi:MAG TPA: long-chain-fatty-acid--CoA ligase [Thermodesulfobacteriota bacterium]|nr:long-chain-fatty-acid--CoA ligase [Thermodesulfobacteriota bacterium]